MSSLAPNPSVKHATAAVVNVVNDATQAAAGVSWSVMMLIGGLTALAISIVAVPIMFFTATGVTGEVIYKANAVIGQQSPAPVTNAKNTAKSVQTFAPNNFNHPHAPPNDRGSAVTPEAFPRVHGAD